MVYFTQTVEENFKDKHLMILKLYFVDLFLKCIIEDNTRIKKACLTTFFLFFFNSFSNLISWDYGAINPLQKPIPGHRITGTFSFPVVLFCHFRNFFEKLTFNEILKRVMQRKDDFEKKRLSTFNKWRYEWLGKENSKSYMCQYKRRL